MLCLGQDITFDEVTATIQISDENNNPPVFTQTHFIGGEAATTWVARNSSVLTKTTVQNPFL